MKTIRKIKPGLFVLLVYFVFAGCNSKDIDDDTDDGSQSQPECSISAASYSGEAPFTVFFSAYSHLDETIVKYEYDVDGDGTYDIVETTGETQQYTYQKAGSYNMKARITNTKGKTAESSQTFTVTEPVYKFPEFKNLELFTGAYWRYKWEVSSSTNGKTPTKKSGYITVSLQEGTGLTVNTSNGETTIFRQTVEKTGDVYPFTFNPRSYIGIKSGVIYLFHSTQDPYIAFNSRTGESGSTGFTGQMNANLKKTVSAANIINDFSSTFSGQGVVVQENLSKDKCEIIAGVRICDDESYHYTLKDYYLPGIGFCGFTRNGTSSLGTGMYVTSISSDLKLWLVETNIKVGPRPPDNPDYTVWNRYSSSPAQFKYTLKAGKSLTDADWNELNSVNNTLNIISKINLYHAEANGTGKADFFINGISAEYPYVTQSENRLYFNDPGIILNLTDLSLQIDLIIPSGVIKENMSSALFDKFSDISLSVMFVKQ